ncbi:hypothetical protein CC1G_15005 [Coprinopsis cinerea okayama7|uniref:Uncharacterized protein n=1 Tax=Coprinopsis cinerea (strain Okayama-7 / 130 / ATCC MYA-4618 / FGSC 9003) TaxID=240176 RepID=D6RP57_COPC7|nr:hypothetical protein CC1G_15005 [Coprinopsis cinerea okayama7\|eukprot:XP_002910674.1 hypothetical protein CC1G_15005 [Coprinopsis cinerea okayama7\
MSGLMEPPPLKIHQKPPLVTPSASPPPSRPYLPKQPSSAPSATSSSHRSASVSSAQQRSRVSATPKPHQTPAPSTGQTPSPEDIDFQQKRQASALRLLDVWSKLAERYTRRLDEDDIVDIVSGRIVKDNGVLRKSKTVWFGNGEKTHGEESGEDEDEEEEEDGEERAGDDGHQDDDDELDAFADVDDGGDEEEDREGDQEEEEEEVLEIKGKVDPVPPVTPQNPLDAADLKEFLETERLRRDVLGSEPEDDPVDPNALDNDGTDAYGTGGSDIYDVDYADVEVDVETPKQKTEKSTVRRSRGVPPVGESDSEDELNFNLAEEAIPEDIQEPEYLASSTDSDDEIEIVKIVQRPPPKPKASPAFKAPIVKADHQTQLQTPPLSRTSMQPTFSSLADELFSTPPPQEEPSIDAPPETPEIPIASTSFKPAKSTPRTPKAQKSQPKDIPSTSKAQKPICATSSPFPKPKVPGKLVPEVVIERQTPFEGASHHSMNSVERRPGTSPTKGELRRERLREEKREGAPEDSTPTTSASTPKASRGPTASSVNTKFPTVDIPSIDKRPDSMNEDHPVAEPSSRRKRKRSIPPSASPGETLAGPSRFPQHSVASSSKVQLTSYRDPDPNVSEGGSPTRAKDARKSIQQRSPRKRRSKSRPRPSPSEDADDSGSESETLQHPNHFYPYYSQHPPNPTYPYAQPLYPPPPPPGPSQYTRGFTPMPPPNVPQHGRGYTPMPDPHSDYFVSQVASRVVAALWNPGAMPPHFGPPPGQPPFTPSSSHHRMSHHYNYATPPHQHYPYPPYHHPDFSRATAPPDTPSERESSSCRSEGGRKKSIVHRSRSKGRAVSFKPSTDRKRRDASPTDDDDDDDDSVLAHSSPLKGKDAASTSASGMRRSNSTSAIPFHASTSKGKGKARQEDWEDEDVADRARSRSDPSSEEESVEEGPLSSGLRGRSRARERTPQPPSSSRSKTASNSKGVSVAKERKGNVSGGNKKSTKNKSAAMSIS